MRLISCVRPARLRLALGGLLAAIAAAAPASAQSPARQGPTPAEQASRLLEQGAQRDRVTEGGAAARGIDTTSPPAQVLPLEADRRSLQPDVGRPEEAGTSATGGTQAPSGSQNPQR